MILGSSVILTESSCMWWRSPGQCAYESEAYKDLGKAWGLERVFVRLATITEMEKLSSAKNALSNQKGSIHQDTGFLQ